MPLRDPATIGRRSAALADPTTIGRRELATTLPPPESVGRRTSALASEYDEMARGPAGMSSEARAEARTAFDDPVGLAAYRDIAGTIIGTGASLLMPNPFSAGGLAGRMAAGGIMGAGGTAGYVAGKSIITGEAPDAGDAVDIGVGGALGALFPWGTHKAINLLKKSAAPLYRTLGVLSERLERMPDKMSKISDDLPQMEAQLRARDAAQRGEAARLAFRRIVPEGTPREAVSDIQWNRAMQAAKREAAKYGKGPLTMQDDPNLAAEMARELQDRLSKVPRVGHIVSRVYNDSRLAWRHFITNSAQGFRTGAEQWKGLGPMLAAKIEQTEFLADIAQGQRITWAENNILRGLSKAERLNLTEAIQGAPPLNDKVALAVQQWRRLGNHGFEDLTEQGIRQLVPPTHGMGQGELFEEVADQAQALATPGTDWIPIPLQFRSNYLPKYRDVDQLRELATSGSKLRRQAIQHLVKQRGFTAAGAEDVLNTILHEAPGGQEFDHSFQFARNDILDELGIAYERDPEVWLRRWSHDTAQRSARAKVWGPRNEGQKEVVKLLGERGGDVPAFDKFWRNFIGHPHPDDVRFSELSRVVGTAQTITGLGPRVRFLQYLQLANPIGKFGVRPVLSAIQATIRDPEMTEIAHMTGATLPSYSMSWVADDVSRAGTWWINHIVGMPRADRFVRIVSSVAGGIKAQEWAQEYARLGGEGPRAEMIARQLESLNLSPKTILNRARLGAEKLLEPEELQIGMLAAANETQFPSHMSDMPPAWRTGPAGRWIYKFRTFAKQQSAFIKDHLIAEARRGNVAPLARYLGSYAVLHEAAAPLLDFISGVEREKDREAFEMALDKLEAYAYTGMLGGMGDALNVGLNSRAGRVASYFFGPSVGNILQTGDAAAEAIRTGDMKPLTLRALRTVPLVGGWAYRWGKENL